MSVQAVPTTGAEPARHIGEARTRSSSGPRTRWYVPWLFLLVPLAFLIVFTYLPVVNMLGYSFTSWDGLSKVREGVGFSNYVEIFKDPTIFRVFFVSLYYIAGSVIQMSLALYFATVLSFNTKFKNFFKGVIFFPYLINGVAIGMVFLYLFQPGGTLDTTLTALGLQSWIHQWLGDPGIVNYSLAGTSVWRYTGLNFVLFLGAIQSIPTEIYEAADLDGANSWEKFRFLIFPSIRRIVGLSFILAISGALSVFEIPYIMTQGANGSETFVISTVNTAFTYRQVGLASAMAVVLLLIVVVVTVIQRKVFPDEKAELS